MDRLTAFQKFADKINADRNPWTAEDVARTVEELALESVRSEALDLRQFVNAADIGGADAPHVIVEKLQAAIDSALSPARAAEGVPVHDPFGLPTSDPSPGWDQEHSPESPAKEQPGEQFEELITLAADFMPESNHAMFVEAARALLARKESA